MQVGKPLSKLESIRLASNLVPELCGYCTNNKKNIEEQDNQMILVSLKIVSLKKLIISDMFQIGS